MNTAHMTTGQLRSAAYDASAEGNTELAGQLYTLAADRYPGNPASALVQADIRNLRELARRHVVTK